MDERQFSTLMARLSVMLQEVRQYVGARYVPNFLDDPWNDTTAYEALDVVDNGMGTSYIAKKPVPAGTLLSNREYWFVYGSTSGAIINLQNQIDAIVNTTIPGINSQIQSLINTVTRKFIFFGDSYGETYEYSGNTIYGWLSKIGSVMGITPSEDSFSSSGYGFYGSGGTYQWQNIISALNVDNDITDVVFVGGTNDVGNGSDATMITAISDTIALAKTKYPNARIWVGFVSIGMADANTVKRLRMLGLYSKNATENGAIFMSSLEYCLYNRAYQLPTAHPNNTGTTVLASAISSVLRGGVYESVIERKSANIVPDGSSDAGTYYGDVNYSVHNDVVTVEFKPNSSPGRWAFTLTTPKAIRANALEPIVFGNIDNIPIESAFVTLGTVTALTIWTTGGVRQCAISFYIENSYLKATVLSETDDHGGYYNNNLADTISSIQFNGVKFDVHILRDGNH